MRHLLLSVVCLVGVSAYAETTLRIPIFLEGAPVAKSAKKNAQARTIPVRWLNAKIKKAGGAAIPEYVEITDQKDAKQFDKISKDIAAAAKLLGPDYKDLDLGGESGPQQNQAGDIKTCYTGRADGVSDTVLALSDVYYSEQIGVWGWKYKKTTKLVDANDDESQKLVEEQSKTWKNWKGSDDAVLVMYHEGDGGDDVEDAIIPRCDD